MAITNVVRRGPRPGMLSTRQRAQRALSRRSVTGAFHALVQERDIDDIAIEDIIIAAGVSRGTFYRHFKSKRDVILALYEDALDRVLPPYDRLVESQTIDQARDCIREIAGRWRRSGNTARLILALEVTDEAFHRRLRNDRTELIERICQRQSALRKALGGTAESAELHARVEVWFMTLERVCAEIALHDRPPHADTYIEILSSTFMEFVAD